VELHELLNEREWRKCFPKWETRTTDELLDAFVHFCSTYWHIRHPERGRILFELRDAQIDTARNWLEHRYTIVLKARQIGFSTLGAAFAFWLAFGYSDRHIIMLSRTERESIKLLQKSTYGYKMLPDWMKVRGPITSHNQTKMAFSNESAIESLPSGNDPARGESVFLVIIDEWAFLPNPDEAWASIEPIADVGGRVIGLSTANGEGNIFHTLWTGCKGHGNGTNRFYGVFHPWWAGDRSDDWYEAKKADLPPWQLAQEYPDNPEEAFLRSGRPVFDVDRLREMPTREPVRGFLQDLGRGIEFVDDGGPLRLWEPPKENGVYCLGVDVAQGFDYGDYSSVHVIDCRADEVVAVWHGHVDPDVLGEEILYLLGKWYNTALIGVESNNHGLTTLKALQRTMYPNIYRQRRLAQRTSAETEILGWRTTAASKPLAIDELSRMLRDGQLGLPCAETIAELRTFVREGNGKMHGSPHDDRTMSLAIANQMRAHAWSSEYRQVESAPFMSVAWFANQLETKDSSDSRAPIGAFNLR
jgi:hypothetical protein